MSDDDDRLTIVCGPASIVALIPVSMREAVERQDGPFSIVKCPQCADDVLLSRSGRMMLADHREAKVICTTCLLKQAPT
jgi:hypothetical protein